MDAMMEMNTRHYSASGSWMHVAIVAHACT
jgi:hypothetical protein